jgi:hypothetical protein
MRELRGQTVGNGHCVAYVRAVAGLPHTSHWRAGERIRDTDPPVEEGTPIATFGPGGRYENRTDGASHAAILIAIQPDGLQVWDQWVGRTMPGQGVQQRFIPFRGGKGKAVDDGDAYRVIELAETADAA